jgi:SAM-dependent methyltransferase
VTLQRSGGASAFSTSADAYAETMAPALRPVAETVVRRANLRPGETVLDVGTGTGTGAGLATGDGRRVIGVDAAQGMLDIARASVPGVEFVEADFSELPLAKASIDAVLAVHALLFADDRPRALAEWLRVTKPGGRLSLSVPGPGDVVPTAIFGHVYDRFGIAWEANDYPTEPELAGWATTAGWTTIDTSADRATGIPLADDDAFRTWLRVGARGRATASWSDEMRAAFSAALMEASPRTAEGGYRLPFGSLYLTARRPG